MIHLSSSAVSEIQRLKAKRKNPHLLCRLSVQFQGCLGLSYLLQFTEAAQLKDQRFHCSGVQVVVDPESLSYLDGLLVDYSEDLMGGGFRFQNPNSAQHCGCGNSFSLAE